MDSQLETLRSRLERQSVPEPNSGCMLWTGYADKEGYGTLRIGGRTALAHRASYHAFRGPIPDGMFVCHHCDTPSCINPAHLFVGTGADNYLDMVRKGRRAERPRKGAPAGTRLGTRNPNAKLTERDVVEIRRAVRDGERKADIAVRYGVGRERIDDIAARRSWSHLPDQP
jgi:hypothetical protein